MGAVPLTVMEVAPDFHRLPSDPQQLRNLGGIFDSVFMIPEGWTEVNAEKDVLGTSFRSICHIQVVEHFHFGVLALP